MIDAKRARYMREEAINYTIADINAAISANPMTPKIRQYLQEREVLEEEQRIRSTKRMARWMVRTNMQDPLMSPLRSRRWIARNAFRRDQWRTGAFLLGWQEMQVRFARKVARCRS